MTSIAGEMLVSAEPFISGNIHPTVIVRAYYKALESAIHICEEIATPIDIHDDYEGDGCRAAWLWTAC